ncbi:MAG: hypothetical protein PHD41_02715, partial [Methanosarcinaceae archaeon]|nr:hypothetical protein [Methanosarcinaceae archaeon]
MSVIKRVKVSFSKFFDKLFKKKGACIGIYGSNPDISNSSNPSGQAGLVVGAVMLRLLMFPTIALTSSIFDK